MKLKASGRLSVTRDCVGSEARPCLLRSLMSITVEVHSTLLQR
jgi:hypothetical protein